MLSSLVSVNTENYLRILRGFFLVRKKVNLSRGQWSFRMLHCFIIGYKRGVNDDDNSYCASRKLGILGRIWSGKSYLGQK